MSRQAPVVVHAPSDLRERAHRARRAGRSIAFVPTIGDLHAGHESLVVEARRRADLVVVSIFVNPTQFGPAEDFARYPRNLERDLVTCERAGADLVFAPSDEQMYPKGHSTRVVVTGIADGLCGASRPGHFVGVATVVVKLLGIVGPCEAIFGRKDYQQLKVIERLVADLDMDVRVVGMPTVREPDGLALSSRNRYLRGSERERALGLARGLTAAHHLAAREPGVSAGQVGAAARGPIEASFDSVDYVAVCDPDTLRELDDSELVSGRVLVAAAARVGGTRLIDNVVVGEDPPPLS